MQERLKFSLDKYGVSEYFVFDMSTPDHLAYIRKEFKSYSRLSDVEPLPVFLDCSAGFWVDSMIDPDFFPTWTLLEKYLDTNKSLCFVSSELHGRSNFDQWSKLRAWPRLGDEKIMICTDLPEMATSFFHV